MATTIRGDVVVNPLAPARTFRARPGAAKIRLATRAIVVRAFVAPLS